MGKTVPPPRIKEAQSRCFNLQPPLPDPHDHIIATDYDDDVPVSLHYNIKDINLQDVMRNSH